MATTAQSAHRRRHRPRLALACGGLVAILAGVATALLAFSEAAGSLACVLLLAAWMVAELLRPTPGRR